MASENLTVLAGRGLLLLANSNWSRLGFRRLLLLQVLRLHYFQAGGILGLLAVFGRVVSCRLHGLVWLKSCGLFVLFVVHLKVFLSRLN